MSPALSRLVAGTAWRDDARAWIEEQARAAGARLVAEPEQRRIAAWSTNIVIETDAGRWWFKALCPSMAFEPALHALLAELVPDHVRAPIAIDAGRGWMLTHDEGEVLGETRTPTGRDWRQVLADAAAAQRALAPHASRILAAGVPDCSPATVPARFDRLTTDLAQLPADHPAHLSAADATQLASARPVVEAAAAELTEAPLPVTLQHGDLHPWNVFAGTQGRAGRIFDFGDAQWAPAAEVLGVPRDWIARKSTLEWADLEAIYAHAWADLADTATVHRLVALADVTQPINRAQTWADSLAGVTPEELDQWGAMPRHHLLRVLDAVERLRVVDRAGVADRIRADDGARP